MTINNKTTKYYQWKNHQCAYTDYGVQDNRHQCALLLIQPVGVGLSGKFWDRFIEFWLNSNQNFPIYNPDLLGCGKSDYPAIAYYAEDWAEQLEYFVKNTVKKPVVLIIQGASFPIGIYLVEKMSNSNLIKGLVLSGPPSWNVIINKGKTWQQKLLWNILFDSPIGSLFYLYARRRKFIKSFSIRQLFAEEKKVDNEWLDTLEKDGFNPKTRYAVFSFLAGFWRRNYTKQINNIQQKTLVLIGDKASSISKEGFQETPEKRLNLYLENLPNSEGKIINGRNVLPYESTQEFAQKVVNFVKKL